MIKNISLGILAIVAIALILIWSDKRTDALMRAMDQYDTCMISQYGMTSAQWYAERGNLPECK